MSPVHARQPTSQFSETASGLRCEERDFEAFLEIFSTLFCKNWRESPWKRNISKKGGCHVREEISNGCFFKDGGGKF